LQVTRGRSKSTSRSTSKVRARTPSSARSRSKTPTRRARTPASESKVRRRRSPSVDPSEESVKSVTKTTQYTETVFDRPVQTDMFKSLPLNHGLSRFSQKIIKKIETEKPTHFYEEGTAARMFPLKRFRISTSCSAAKDSIFIIVLKPCLVARFLPIGRIVTTGIRNIDYRCNSLMSFIIFIGLFAFAEISECTTIRNLKPSEMLPNLWLSLLTSSCLASLFLSFVAYFASKTVVRYTRQSAAKTSSIFLDFWCGRHVRPQWFGIDWKMTITRSGLMALPLIDLTYIFRQYEQYERISPALAAHALMHALWVLDFFIFEHTFSFTYEAQSVTFGSCFIISRLVALPFVYSITSSYLSSRPDVGRQLTSSSKHSCNAWIMGIAIVLFLLGLWIYRRSNNQKDRFRRDPHDPSFANAEIVVGPGAQRLLVSGLWGYVRHPNYVGYIILAVAMQVPCGFDSPLLWGISAITILNIIHRSIVVEDACLRKHGPAWQKYTALVPYRFIPKVF
uniref:Lamin b receptor n=1 Tax=Schistosoma curassoni TaxID=6186 RepID=A0A183KJP8_9TREM